MTQGKPPSKHKLVKAFEKKVRRHYRDLGYLAQSAGENQPVFDILALAPKGMCDQRPLLIQCKTHNYLPPWGQYELEELADQFGARAMFASRNSKHELILTELTPTLEGYASGASGSQSCVAIWQQVREEGPRTEELDLD